jgi:hypothetical protein
MKPWGIVHGCCGFKRLETKNKEKLTKIIDEDLEKRGHLEERSDLEEERNNFLLKLFFVYYNLIHSLILKNF